MQAHVIGQRVGQSPDQRGRLHQGAVGDMNPDLVKVGTQSLFQLASVEGLVIGLHGVEVVPKVIVLPDCRLAGGSMNEAVTLPLAVYSVCRNLAVEQFQAGLVDAIDAAVVIDLLFDHAARKVAAGDDESRVPARSRFAHPARIQQQDFVTRMKLGQPSRAGQPGQAGANHYPGHSPSAG